MLLPSFLAELTHPENIHTGGVYLIRCKVTDSIYVGSTTTSFLKRGYAHFYRMKRGIHENPYLQNAVNKYGLDSFEFIVWDICSPDLAVGIEQFWINTLEPAFNILKVAGNRRGFKLSEETKAKLRNKKVTAETRKLLSEARRKQVFTPDVIKKRNKNIAKPIITEDGQEFASIQEASLYFGIPASTLSRWLTGYTNSSKRKITLRYKDK